MAISGTFRNTGGDISNVGAGKWGDGIARIHAVRGGPGRNTTPGTIPEEIGQVLTDHESYGYTDEDWTSNIYGNGVETGTADRPAWGEGEHGEARTDVEGFPQWGPYRGGAPGGQAIRTIEHGAEATNDMKNLPREPWAEDFDMRGPGSYEAAETSDPSQYEMQTSMVQRMKVRAGSQRSGTASEYDAPIPSRVVGQRIRHYAGGARHADMTPKSQDMIIRPFHYRTAGTGDPANMTVNEMYVSEPRQRVPAAEPNQGSEVVGSGESFTDDYGYTGEDYSTW